MEAPPINGNHVIEESEVDKPTEVEMETLAMEEQPTKKISIETNGPTNEIPIETNGISEDPKVWQYWLWSFKFGDTNFFKVPRADLTCEVIRKVARFVLSKQALNTRR